MLIKIVHDKSTMVDDELGEKIWNMKIKTKLTHTTIHHPDDGNEFFLFCIHRIIITDPSSSQTDRIIAVVFSFYWFSFFFEFVAEIFFGHRAARVTFNDTYGF